MLTWVGNLFPGLPTVLGVNVANHSFDSSFLTTGYLKCFKCKTRQQISFTICFQNRLMTTYINIPKIPSCGVPCKGVLQAIGAAT